MTTHAVLQKYAVAAANINSLNRYAMAGSSVNLDNGNVFRLDTENTAGTSGYSEVWDTSAPSLSGSTLGSLWMAGTFGRNLLVDGTLIYAGLNDDPRKFYNPGARVFDAYKPQVEDVISMTADAFTNTRTAETFANAADGVYTLTWGSTQTASALSYKLISATDYISIGTGGFGDTQRVTSYKLRCVAN